MTKRALFSPASGILGLGLMVALSSAAAGLGLASDWAEGHSSRARLIAGGGLAGVELQMPEGWKTYWRNPGDAGGVPPSFDWSRSENLAAATVLYPAPRRFTDRSGDTVGYKGRVVFPVRLEAKDPTKPIALRLKLDYGICKEICVPVEADLSLAIAPQTSAAPPELAAALHRVPSRERRPGDPQLLQVRAELDAASPRLVLEAEFPGGAEGADVFIEGPQGLNLPQPRRIAEDGDRVTFAVELADAGDARDLKHQALTATLVSDSGQAEASFSVD